VKAEQADACPRYEGSDVDPDRDIDTEDVVDDVYGDIRYRPSTTCDHYPDEEDKDLS